MLGLKGWLRDKLGIEDGLTKYEFDDKDAAKIAAGGAALLGGRALLGGFPGAANAAGGYTPQIRNASGIITQAGMPGGAGGDAGGWLGGLLGGAWDWTKKNPMQAGGMVLGGLNALQGAREGREANKLRDEALRLAREDWESRKDLRKAGMDGLMAPIPERQSLGGMFADPGNPYWRAQ